MSDPFAIEPGLLVWTLITFGCLFFVLARFAFKPLRKILDEREDAIRDAIERAEQAKQQAEKALAENDQRMEQAREEARRVISEGHRIVAEMKREAQHKARDEANMIVGRARSEIDRELQRSLDDLKGTVANLSVRIARQVIQERMDEEQHRKLADRFIERLKKSYGRHDS